MIQDRSIFHRIAWNWRVHGIPRCAAWFAIDQEDCRRLIWPWQRTGGNGEDVEHFDCMLAEDAQHLLADALEDEAA